MINKINELIEKRFTDDSNAIVKYDENGNSIIDTIEELFSNDTTIKEYSIDTDIVFENSGCEFSYLSIAYIYNNKLEHITYIVETY